MSCLLQFSSIRTVRLPFMESPTLQCSELSKIQNSFCYPLVCTSTCRLNCKQFQLGHSHLKNLSYKRDSSNQEFFKIKAGQDLHFYTILRPQPRMAISPFINHTLSILKQVDFHQKNSLMLSESKLGRQPINIKRIGQQLRQSRQTYLANHNFQWVSKIFM